MPLLPVLMLLLVNMLIRLDLLIQGQLVLLSSFLRSLLYRDY